MFLLLFNTTTMETTMETEVLAPLTFTRYLYPKELVMQSLFLSILDKKTDEALFWGYELYYSGFDNIVYEYLFQIYHIIYSYVNNAKLTTYIQELYETQNESNV